MPETTKGPRRFPVLRDQPPQGEGRLATHRIVKMGVEGIPRAQTRWLEARHRPQDHQQALPKEVHENGDLAAPKADREARRPLGILRP
ncbi:MAG: hypothetical protein ACK55Z_21180, partial [bacterium]